MHMDQQAIAVLFGNVAGSEDVAIHTCDRHLLGVNAELLAHARQRLDDLVSARFDQHLPCGGILGMIVPERWKRCSDQGLLLQANVGSRYRDFLGWDLASGGFEREGRSRHGEADGQNCEMQSEACFHWSPPPDLSGNSPDEP